MTLLHCIIAPLHASSHLGHLLGHHTVVVLAPENKHMINYVALLTTNPAAYNMPCTQHMLQAPDIVDKRLHELISQCVRRDVCNDTICGQSPTAALLSITMTLMTYKHLAG